MAFHYDFRSLARFTGTGLLDSAVLYAEAAWMRREFIDDEQTWRPYLNANREVPAAITKRSLLVMNGELVVNFKVIAY